MKKMGIFTDEDRRRYATIWDELEKHFDEKDKRLLAHLSNFQQQICKYLVERRVYLRKKSSERRISSLKARLW